MKLSQSFTKTTKTAPADETSQSAKYLLRAGYIYKEMAGVYDYLPLGMRTLEKIIQIIREEMNAIGGKGSSIGMDFSGAGGGDTTRAAAEIAIREGKISTSLLQRRLHVGYGRAASIIDELVEKGVVGDSGGGNRGRDVLISSMDEYPD